METTLILNSKTVNEGKISDCDLLLRHGRIERIGGDLSSLRAGRLIDAGGLYLLPGLIDDQVHFREPGLTHKAEISTESAAAVAGGVTSYMDMPNVFPPTLDMGRLRDKMKIAARNSLANYSFYLGAGKDNLENIKTVDRSKVCGIKIFMGSSTGNMLVDDMGILENIFRHSPLLIATHCEDSPMITENEATFKERHGSDIPAECHPEIRSREACLASSAVAVDLARKHDARLHVLHITTAEELDLFDRGGIESKRITAEACVHHLWFSDRDYADKGHLIKCNPAIKTTADRNALQSAINRDIIDVIATDHAPHTSAEKRNEYLEAPSGLPLVQHSLLTLLEHYHNGIFTLEKIVEKACHNPARLFDIADRGYIREGYAGRFGFG